MVTPGPALVRAQSLVEARDPTQVTGVRAAEHRTVAATNRWRHRSRTVRGTAIGCRHTDGAWTDEVALVVLVSKKLPTRELAPEERVPRQFTVEGERICTDVLQIGRPKLHAALVGTQIVAEDHQGTNFGTVGGLLQDAGGGVYMLSAAHVLCEAARSGGKRKWLRAGSPVFRTATNSPDAIGHVFDRVIPDFGNSYLLQNIDAAVAALEDPGSVDPSEVPYGAPREPSLMDAVTVVGAVNNQPPAAPVRLTNAQLQFRYVDSNDRMRLLTLQRLCLAEYACFGGDSGAMVMATSDHAAVGLHMGAQTLSDSNGPIGTFGVFAPITSVLAQWPGLRLVHQ